MKAKIIALAVATAAVGGGGYLALTQEHEGAVYRTYLDPVGIPTACYGHTGPEVKMGQTYTKAQCDMLFQIDWAKHDAGAMRCTKVPLTPGQRWAVVDFAFNVGVGNYCRSTLNKKLNAGDYAGAAAEFPKWKYGKVRGKAVVLPGLVRRRADEQRVFLTQ